MKLFEKVFRLLIGSKPTNPLAEVFDKFPDATSGVVLKEIGLPYGGITTYFWWRTKRQAYFLKTHQEFNDSVTALLESAASHESLERFDEVLSIVEANGSDLKSYRGKVRDGVHYSLHWGTPERQYRLTIDNPPPDSRHQELVTLLKASGLLP